MALSNITVKGVTPDLSILGSYQRFSYEDNVSSFQLDNIFVSTTLIPSQMNIEFRNSQLSGFRWYHTTTSTDSFGSLALQSFVNASPNGTDIITFDQDGSINFIAPITIGSLSIGNNLDMNNYRIIDLADPVDPQDAATKAYVDSAVGSGTITLTGAVTGSGTGTINTALTDINTSQISNFDTAVKSYNLNQFVAPTSTLNVNDQKISFVGVAETGTDAANLARVIYEIENATITSSQVSDFTPAVESIISSSGGGSVVYPIIAGCFNSNNTFADVALTPSSEQKLTNLTIFRSQNTSNFTSPMNNRILFQGTNPGYYFSRITGAVQIVSTIANLDVWVRIIVSGQFVNAPVYYKQRIATANLPYTLPIDTNLIYNVSGDYAELFVGASAHTTVRAANMSWVWQILAEQP